MIFLVPGTICSDALLGILRAASPLFASRAQEECNKLPSGEPTLSVDPPTFLTHPPKLKKLVNRVVQELIHLGFSPETVQDLIERENDASHAMKDAPDLDERSALIAQSHATTNPGLKLRYEVCNDLGHLVPRLKLIVNDDIDVDATASKPEMRMTHF